VDSRHTLLLASVAFLGCTLAAAEAQTTIDTAFTATSANVKQAGTPVTIRLFRWSTDEERTPMLAALNPPPASPEGPAGRAAAARGRGARGRGRGGPPLSPIDAFTAAVRTAPTIGFIWTSDVTGYSIKYAWRSSSPNGERIVLVTDRRLGANTVAWDLVSAPETTDYEFTVIEMLLGPKGAGEAKTSLTAKVVVDRENGTVALENFATVPAILQNLKRAG
jgi:hypothetical protein